MESNFLSCDALPLVSFETTVVFTSRNFSIYSWMILEVNLKHMTGHRTKFCKYVLKYNKQLKWQL